MLIWCVILTILCAPDPIFDPVEKFNRGFRSNPQYCDGVTDGTSASDYWIGNHDFDNCAGGSGCTLPTWNGGAVLPTKGLYCNFSNPGSRQGQSLIHFPERNEAFVFGGYGYDSTQYVDYMNDVWSFNYTSSEWAYHHGSTYHYDPWIQDYNHGVNLFPKVLNGPGTTNPTPGVFQNDIAVPGGRTGSVLFHSLREDSFFLFGGYGYTNPRTKLLVSNNVWEFDITLKRWTHWIGVLAPTPWDGLTDYDNMIWIVDYGWDYYLFTPRYPLPGAQPSQRAEVVLWEPSDDPNVKVMFGGFVDEKRAWNDVWFLHIDDIWIGSGALVARTNDYGGAWELKLPLDASPNPYPCKNEEFANWNNFDDNNVPAARASPFYWNYLHHNDTYDRMYMFGGFDNCRGEFLSDLWRYDYMLNQWMPIRAGSTYDPSTNVTHRQKSSSTYAPGIYTETTYPGSRAYGKAYVIPKYDSAQEIYDYYVMFLGGLGLAGDGPGFLSDIWTYSQTNNRFSQINEVFFVNDFGNYTSVDDKYPAGRYNLVNFVDQDGSNDGVDWTYYLMNGLAYKDYQVGDIAEVWTFSFGATCQGYYIFEPEVCSSHGLCIDSDMCSCSYQYEGDDCQTLKHQCDGIYYDQPGICNYKGECFSQDNCSCVESYYGQFCQEMIPTEGHNVEFVVDGDFIYSHGGVLNYTVGSVNATYSRVVVDLEIPLDVGPNGPEVYGEVIVGHSDFDCCRFIENCNILGDIEDSRFVITSACDGRDMGEGFITSFMSQDSVTLYGPLCYFDQEGEIAITGGLVDKFYVILGESYSIGIDNPDLEFIIFSDPENNTVTLNTEGWPVHITTTKNYIKDFFTRVGPVMGGMAIILCCAICCCSFICSFVFYGFWRIKKRLDEIKKLRHLDIIRKEREFEIGQIANFEINEDLFNIDADEMKMQRVISNTGATAIVYLASYKGKDVAFKCFKTNEFSTQTHMDDFEKEVKMLSNLVHENLLIYYGSMRKPPRIGIITEFCHNGDLRNYLMGTSENGDKNCSLANRFRFISEIANVMAFLNSKSIVHRDLKGDNILLTQELKCKLIDFGLSRVVEGATSVYLTKQAGTSQYMAPEVTLSSRYGEKCDVFSVGVIMYEVITGDFFPYGERPEFNVELKVALNPDFRPPIQDKPISLVKHTKFYKRAWSVDVDDRPSFEELEKAIADNREACIENMKKMEEFMFDTVQFKQYVERDMSDEDLIEEGDHHEMVRVKKKEETEINIDDLELHDLLDLDY